jgi:hypothetical protein
MGRKARSEIILESFEAMARVLPEAFTQGAAEQRRETMLLHALLKQVSGVGLVTLDRLYASALTSLEALLKANPVELSTTTGISMSLCDAICEKLREHRMEIDRTAHLPLEQRFGARLRELLTELAREHEEFERLSDDGGFDDGRAERKRACRRSRNLCALKIEATLVEMGEIDRADRLRVLSFDQRIASLQEFLGVRVAKRATEQR